MTMSKTYFTRKRGAQYRFSEEERSRFDKLTDAKIEALALSDPDNPPQTEEQLGEWFWRASSGSPERNWA